MIWQDFIYTHRAKCDGYCNTGLKFKVKRVGAADGADIGNFQKKTCIVSFFIADKTFSKFSKHFL